MAGETHQEQTDETGRTARAPRPRTRSTQNQRGAERERATRPRAAIQIHLDGAAALPAPIRAEVTARASTPSRPDILPRLIKTQVAYRQLVSSGLTSTEAAGLIGYVSGLGPNPSTWTMIQINRLLFLRSLYHEAEWGQAERRAAS